jgi:cytochrome c oxidase cbb3-type subunit 4
MMDKGTWGAISTVLAAIAFVGVAWWAFAPSRRKRFEEDANLPFADEQNDEQKAKKAKDDTNDR